MLDELHVRDYALVSETRLRFSPGCTVLTGETGAGKTALVGAIKLLIGERGETQSIRDGSDELIVEGRIYDGSDEHVVVRRFSREGRSRCVLDGEMSTVKALATQVGVYFDLHGQHEHQSLLSPSVQLEFLDRYAGSRLTETLDRYRCAWEAHRVAITDLSAFEEAAQASEASLEQARFIVREIEAVSPLEGEYEELEAQLPILRNGEGLSTASGCAYEALRDENGALERISQAQQALERESGVDGRLDEMARQMESLLITADDLASSLRGYRDGIEFNPQVLDEALGRLGELEGLKKRFGPGMDEVFEKLEDARVRLAAVDDAEGRRAQLETQLAECERELRRTADELAECRRAAGAELAGELNAVLGDLAMGGAEVRFAEREIPFGSWSALASVAYEMMYKPSAGSVARPLAKIASGGELSRVMLALKTLQKTTEHSITLVFDEVDAGIGGATATAVASYIASLAARHQVLVVTHLAQIAAVANRHYVVKKTLVDETATTTIAEVVGEERVGEIARMLSGSEDDIALKHARRLLEGGGAQ
ncbi:MAG TPA: DNA repair protein RecN [Coriobacteriia bacterium]|nr:DNA repair protein RecN [Coriobacteriia bacterium]